MEGVGGVLQDIVQLSRMPSGYFLNPLYRGANDWARLLHQAFEVEGVTRSVVAPPAKEENTCHHRQVEHL